MSDKTLKQKQQRQDKERQAYAFYVAQGWTSEQAIGIVGNLIRESNLNTTVVGTADDKGSQGIAQWHSGRLKTLKDRYGDKWTDFRNQLEFVDWELKNTEKVAGDKLKASKGIWEAGKIVSDSYERPKVKFSGDDKRQRHVSDLAMKFKGVRLTPQDMPYYEASYTKSVAPYINQQKKTVTPTLNYFDIPKETTTFASVPDSAEKEETTEKIDKDIVEVEQKTKEYNFLEELQKEDYSHLQPQQVVQQQTVPQVDFMQQYEQVSQFIDEPLVAQQGMLKKAGQSNMKMILNSINKRENTEIFPSAKVDNTFNFGWEPPKKQLSITDNRKINATTGKPINPNVDLTSGKYNQDTIEKIITSANLNGVDPYTALAVGLQESKLGTTDSNIGHVIGKQNIDTKGITSDEDYFVRVLKSKIDSANKLGIKDEDTILQTYNGLGKIYPETEQGYHGFKMKKIYGVDVPKEGIDMRKNPLYGKRIIDLRENVLKQNPKLVEYVESIVGKVNPFTGQTEKETNQYLPQFQQGGKFSENELAFLSEIAIKDNNGYWDKSNQGKVVEIEGNKITMNGVKEDLIGISKQTGEKKIMKPNKNYTFSNTKSVIEIPLFKNK